MLEQLNSIDTDFFLAINGAHASFFDFLFYWISDRLTWIPLYLFLGYLLFKNYGRRAWVLVIMAIMAVVLSDQSVTYLFKYVFHRLRPCHEPSIVGIVHLVNGNCGGAYGFISSHASNTFALATFLLLLLGKKIRFFTPLIILWALLNCYSRVYLGVHYPGDVIVGAIWGAGLGASIYVLTRIPLLHNLINRKRINIDATDLHG